MINIRTIVVSVIAVFACGAGTSLTGAEIPATQPGQSTNAFRYAGHVLDEKGQPIAGAEVIATHRDLDGHSYGYIDSVTTDAQGFFQIDRARALSGMRPADAAGSIVRLEFRHPDHAFGQLEGLQLLSREQVMHLGVILAEGRGVHGQVVDTKQQPVTGALVEVTFGGIPDQRRGVLTDATGHFSFHGLPSEPATINVLTVDTTQAAMTGQRAIYSWQADAGRIALEAVSLPAGTIVHELLGMKLVDISPPIQKSFHLTDAEGVLVLDPGPQSDRLKIGQLQRGDVFWVAGTKNVKDFNDFKQILSAEAAKKETAIRVVYSLSRPGFSGSNTQSLVLNQADAASLMEAAQ
jgi:hypothetical protein